MSTDPPLVVLCPGQGAQHVSMGQSWAQNHSIAADTFHRADEVLGVELSQICFEGPEEKLNRTDFAQAAIYTTSVACWRALEAGGRVAAENLAAIGGLSLGEYTALHLAGVFSFEEGLQLVWQRGHFMQEAAEASSGSMVALMGSNEAEAQALCDAARGQDVLVTANFNCPGQIVLSGSEVACDRALKEAAAQGVRAKRLSVAGAFHSALMQPAADRMAEVLAKVPLAPPRCTVLANVTGEPHEPDPATLSQRLVEQITSAVRWQANARWLAEHHSGRYIELAPGKVLAGLMRRTDRSVSVESHPDA